MTTKNLLCPHCKNDNYLRTMTDHCQIVKDENDNITDTEINEIDVTYKCTDCDKQVDEEGLI